MSELERRLIERIRESDEGPVTAEEVISEYLAQRRSSDRQALADQQEPAGTS